MLTAVDYQNIIAMINRASVQGAEVEEIASLKAKVIELHRQATRPPAQNDMPVAHGPVIPLAKD